MDWTDDVRDALPAPRGDEPANLRRDIADELGDHLACAMDRERRQTDDEEAAKATVISRFGSPQAIARRLWWDAMKERIMTQRLSLAAAVTAAVACLVVVALSWMTFQQTRLMHEQAREVNLAIIAKLKSFASPPPVPPPQSLEWTEVRFRCAQESEDGLPAEEFRVELTGNPINESQTMTLKETAGNDGVVKFGPIRPGQYTYQVFSPWNQSTYGQFILLPGQQTDELMLCPAGPPETASLRCELKWPEQMTEKLKEAKLQDSWVQCVFSRTGPEAQFGDRAWYHYGSFSMTVLPNGKLLDGFDLVDPNMGGLGGGLGAGFFSVGGSGFPQGYSTAVDFNQHEPRQSVKWPKGDYKLTSVSLFKSQPDPMSSEKRLVTVLGGYSLQKQVVFQLNAGVENAWTIEVPVIDLTNAQAVLESLPQN